jgi:nucleoside-diphosphate-sugar epimerase
MTKFAFVAGATGAAATRLIEELVRQKWRVIGVSRSARKSKTASGLTYLSADLLDAGEVKAAISPYRDITHLFFTARASHEETGVEPVAENVAMLRNALAAAEADLRSSSMSTLFKGPSGTECISAISRLQLARTTRDMYHPISITISKTLLPSANGVSSGLGRLRAPIS